MSLKMILRHMVHSVAYNITPEEKLQGRPAYGLVGLEMHVVARDLCDLVAGRLRAPSQDNPTISVNP